MTGPESPSAAAATGSRPVGPSPLACRDLVRVLEADGQARTILKGISFALDPGTFTAVMGPSGSGKSTLLHILAGLDVPTAGSVHLAGEELTGRDEEDRTRMRRDHIGFVFQFFNLLPDLTVAENVALPWRIAGRRADKAERSRLSHLLEGLGLGALANRRPAQLSGGEMQRVSIARALAGEPALLLCDEPTGNLSSKAGAETIALLREVVAERGSTVLLVTHNARDAAAADRVLFLHDGQMDPAASLEGGHHDAADVHRRLEELGI